MIRLDDNFDDDTILLFVPKNDPLREQVQFCRKFIISFFQKRNTPCKQEFSEVKIRRQVLDPHLPGTSKLTSFYGIFTIKIFSLESSNQPPHQDDIKFDCIKIV